MIGGNLVERGLIGPRVVGGTWSAATTWTIPAVTLGGIVAGGNYALNNIERIGVGNIASEAKTAIYGWQNAINPTEEQIGVKGVVDATATTGNNAQELIAGEFIPQITAANVNDWTGVIMGVMAFPKLFSPSAGSYTVATTSAVRGGIVVEANTTVTTHASLYAEAGEGAGIITNFYGLYIENIAKGSSLNYAIYLAGATGLVELNSAPVYSFKLGEAMDANSQSLGTIGATTLGAALTVTGQVFDAGAGDAAINTTGAFQGLLLTSTNVGTSGALIKLYQNSSSPDVNDLLGALAFDGKDSNADYKRYGYISGLIENVTTGGTQAGKLQITLLNANADNLAMTLSGAGALWSDLSVDTLTYKVSGTQVVGARVVDARADDVVDSTYGAEEAGVLDALRDAMIAHGLIAAA